ncbi:hypothetical protein E6C27_scaffold41454G00010 [Cucumis melo var. makuwa]|uniref:Ty3-gypsy retrotransposon protein n=1 Tax=Cucumis melo var. makuwa TaxID=1194695 RepID=A0A5A7UJT5_CUCMM|nr:hypothetical protein E6C27_scaffold41454G00010 [Cucumis melo var. makuwa]
MTLEFRSVTTSVVGTNSPLFGWICLDVELNKQFSHISVKEFLTTGPRTETGNVVTHMGIILMLVSYVVNWNSMSMDYEVLMLCKVEVCCRDTGYEVMSWKD